MLAGATSQSCELVVQTRRDADGAGLRFLVHVLSAMNQKALAAPKKARYSEPNCEATQLRN